MHTHTFQALGTQWSVEIFDEKDSAVLESAFRTLEHFVQDFEATYSRFKADSLVSILNQDRMLHTPSEECHALLTYGKQLYLRTNTHFNFLTGNIQEARGYDATYSFTPDESKTLTPGNPVTDLHITAEKIELSQGNIDLGGFGKGYLIDELATLLQKEYSLQYFLINGGGDLYATSDHGTPIQIFLEHPTKPSHFIHTTTIKQQGFAASSPFKRMWHSGDKTYTHIVANSETPRIASFVKAKTARDADAFATTTLLLTESEILTLSLVEEISVARFTPATNNLWRTNSFDT
ncbi:FAD:protein FMN transferase [Candidatus Kaiserbacteria bacterium]|nr:FAD:protein FMN transferase [Candidatus Kaiserbacteria bacterium]NCT02196.1 FAD:protein FMN transferase [Candidatus Parcubacteria bacterium]